jgi:hypothetical protein
MFFDGSCPLCAREVGVYQRLSKQIGSRIRFHDLSVAGVGELGAFGITLGGEMCSRKNMLHQCISASVLQCFSASVSVCISSSVQIKSYTACVHTYHYHYHTLYHTYHDFHTPCHLLAAFLPHSPQSWC